MYGPGDVAGNIMECSEINVPSTEAPCFGFLCNASP